MKKLFLSMLLFCCYSTSLFSQDIMVMKSGDEIKVKVSEILPDVVKYKKWDNQDGPLYSEVKANIFMIKYKNGTKEVFANKTENATTTSSSSSTFDKFLGDWRCSIESGGIVKRNDELKISGEAGNPTLSLTVNSKSVQNTGLFENNKIKITFPVLGETQVTYAEIGGKPYIYVFGTQMERSLKSSLSAAFTGLVTIDANQAFITVVFKEIKDEIVNHEQLLLNKMLALLRSDSKIKALNANSTDNGKYPLKYQLEYQLNTLYSSEPSILNPGSTAYTADLRLELFLFKINEAGQKIKGFAAKTQVIHMKKSALSGGYVTKQGAFDAMLPEIDKPFYQQLNSLFSEHNPETEIAKNDEKSSYASLKIITGSWHGEVGQGRKSYSIQLTCNAKNNDFKVGYPTLGCAGYWTIEKSSDRSIDFREGITAGQNSCGNGALIRVDFKSDTQIGLDFYNKEGKKIIAHAELTKE